MGKKRKGQSNQGYRPDEDKPDYAMDKMRPEVKIKEPEVPREQQLRVEDRLGKSAMAGLSALKEKMEAEAAKVAEAPSKSKKKSAVSPKRPDPDDKDVSFAELFDPGEEDDESFEELLGSSKQDWREYK